MLNICQHNRDMKNMVLSDWTCEADSTITYVLGVLLCIGGILSYLPQYIALIKSKKGQGVSELSLFILNVGSLCLACNSLILNWWQFECYNFCSFFLCSGNLLAFYQILLGWIMVFPLYLIYVYMQYKLKETSKTSFKTCLYGMSYIIAFAIFLTVLVLLLAIEKFTYNNINTLYLVAYVLGVASMVCSGIVWIPQIVKLIKTKDEEGLSLVMFLIQTPGSAIIIVFQAILNKQNVSTWISYVFNFTEQLLIVIILIILMIRKWKMRAREANDELEEVGHVLIEDGVYNK